MDTAKQYRETTKQLEAQLAQMIEGAAQDDARIRELEDELEQALAEQTTQQPLQHRGRTLEQQMKIIDNRTSISRSASRRRKGVENALPVQPLTTGLTTQHTRVQHSRGQVTARSVTAVTSVSVGSVAVNLNQPSTVTPNRDVPVPRAFAGTDEEFYPWLRTLENKLGVTSFRSVEDGLRYVQGLLGGSAWSQVNARVLSAFTGYLCKDSYASVEDMIRL